ncbi:hypothetical protein YPPY100_1079, partial [Yersinia pestis PY-100]
MARGNSETG